MTIKHEVKEPWRSHLAAAQQSINTDNQTIAILRGQIAEIERRTKERLENAGSLVRLLVAEAELPATHYVLSEGAQYLTGEISYSDEPLKENS